MSSTTPAQARKAQLQKLLAQRVLARRRLLQFTQMTHPSYSAGWVHDDICRRLERFSQEVAEKKSPRLMLLMPPRHGKSELASIRFPAWHLGHNPTHELINVGYNLELPMRFSRKVREVMRDPHYKAIFPDSQLDPDSQSAEAWNTTKGGGFTAAGVGGGITGKGAHVLVIDDPLKNQEEADSILVRDKLWDWYQSTAYTRLAPGGGVLVIECMVGDTPVLMADGTERRLDAVTAGDVVATYRNGALSSARVAAQRSSGRDYLLKITTMSGRVVRANGRHPFLTVVGGEQVWTRAQFLTTDHTIVVAKASAVSGLASRAQQMGALSLPSAEVCATSTTAERSGPMDTARPDTQIKSACGTPLGSTGMESLEPSTTGCSASSTGYAQYVGATPPRSLSPKAGGTSCVSTTTTTPGGFVASFATSATSESATLPLSPWHVPPQTTCDFTLDPIVSVEPDGYAEVFDLQVEGTENFIANGLVSHNTWWNDDDLAGRLQAAMAAEEDADQFEIVRYPALSEAWEIRDETTSEILRRDDAPPALEPHQTLLRPKDFCLHEDRYPTDALKRIRANLQPRIWSALYQQNPVPDEGMYFKKEYFRYQKALPSPNGLRIYTAWDFAIGEKQQNDWTVGATVLQDETDTIYVLEIFRMKGDSFQIVEAMLDVALRWGSIPTAGYLVGAEDGQIWRAIEPLLKKRMGERRQYPPYEVMRPMTDKLARARPLQGRMQQGRVVFPEGAAWLGQAEQELLRFPAGAHDDVVDALAWAAQLCMGKEPPRLAAPPPLPSWRDKLSIVGGQGSHMSA